MKVFLKIYTQLLKSNQVTVRVKRIHSRTTPAPSLKKH